MASSSNLQISFLNDSFAIDHNDQDIDTPVGNKLNFSHLLFSNASTVAPLSPTTTKKRTRINFEIESNVNNGSIASTPANKKQRTSFNTNLFQPPPSTSVAISDSGSLLNPIDENSTFSFAKINTATENHQEFNLNTNNTNDINDNSKSDQKSKSKSKQNNKPKKTKTKRKKKEITQPLRRSARIRNKNNPNKDKENEKSEEYNDSSSSDINTPGSNNTNTTNSSSKSKDSLHSIAIPLSTLSINKKPTTNDIENGNDDISPIGSPNHNHNNKNHRNKSVRIDCEQNEIRERSQSYTDWDGIFSANTMKNKWNSKLTPIKSSLKITKKHKKRTNSMKKVNWGCVDVTHFEQRCGVLSCGVPNSLTGGPSLHLGKEISQTSEQIDIYENQKNMENNEWKGELNKRQRIDRVKIFSPKDVNRASLKEDLNEIKRLRASREDIGCDCMSIYKMKKDQIIGRIMYLKSNDENNDNMDKKIERKRLSKLKKPDVMKELMKIQFDKYGRYDVCCVDETCTCFKNGIECQIDSDCCKCGGNIVYNNYLDVTKLIEEIKEEDDNKDKNRNKKKEKKKVKKINKRDSLSCGNKWGNTLNTNVLDYVNKNGDNKEEHEILKEVETSFLSFTSPAVQNRITDWNKHYDMSTSNEFDIENKENVGSEIIRKSLNFS